MKPGQEAMVHARVRLCPLTFDDIETTRVWRNRDDTRRWFKHADVLTAEQQRAWFAVYLLRNNDFIWLVEDVGRPGIPLGQVALYDIDRKAGVAEIGRCIAAPEARGQGYLSAACRGLIHHAFANLNLDALRLEVFHDNAAALGLYRRCGFREINARDGLLIMRLERAAWTRITT